MLNLLGENGEHWCKGSLARDSLDRIVDPQAPEATKWCLLGACIKLGVSEVKFWQSLGERTISGFNDDNDWPTVKAKLLEIENAQRDIKTLR